MLNYRAMKFVPLIAVFLLACSVFNLDIDQVKTALEKSNIPIEKVTIEKNLTTGTGQTEAMQFTVNGKVCSAAVYTSADAAKKQRDLIDSSSRLTGIEINHFIFHKNALLSLPKDFNTEQVETFRKALESL